MNFQLPKCKYYIWTCELEKIDSDTGDCINPKGTHVSCGLCVSQKRGCYEEGSGSWGPGNDKKIKKHKEILELEGLFNNSQTDGLEKAVDED